MLRHLPIFLDIAQGQEQQFGRRLLTREVTKIIDDLSQAHMRAFDGIGCLDNRAHFGRIGKERNHLLPLAPLHRDEVKV
jgi:hypothetical protein